MHKWIISLLISFSFWHGASALQQARVRLQRPDAMIHQLLSQVHGKLSWRNWAIVMTTSVIIAHIVTARIARLEQKNKTRHMRAIRHEAHRFIKQMLMHEYELNSTKQLYHHSEIPEDAILMVQEFVNTKKSMQAHHLFKKKLLSRRYKKEQLHTLALRVGAIFIPIATLLSLAYFNFVLKSLLVLNNWTLTASFDTFSALSHGRLFAALPPVCKLIFIFYFLKIARNIHIEIEWHDDLMPDQFRPA